MKIKKVTIDNFRNIEHAEYELYDMNIFSGPNGTGKSNTILAIYWVLNDYLMDGTSDDISNKPFVREKDTKTSVELEFSDGWKIRKEYWENWVKKRGQNEKTMEGNLTQYYIRGDKVTVKEARQELIKRLGLDVQNTTKGFNLSLALSDPIYIGERVDQNVLRSFIIDLVGDVKNDDVFETDDIFEKIRPLLNEYDGDPSLVIKTLKKKIKSCKDDISGKEKAVEVLKKTKDVSEDDFNNAKSKIYQIEDKIAVYRNQKVTSINNEVSRLEKEISNIKLKLSESIASDNDYMSNANFQLNRKIEKARNDWRVKKSELETLNNERFDLDRKKRIIEDRVIALKKSISEKETQLDDARAQYSNISKSEFVNPYNMPEEVKCPECGYLLNQDAFSSIEKAIEVSQKQFEEEKKKRIAENINKGKTLKLEIENMTKEIIELENNINNFEKSIDEMDNQIMIKNKEVQTLEDLGTNLSSELINNYVSKETMNFQLELKRLKEALDFEKEHDHTIEDIEEKIRACIHDKLQYEGVISMHNNYIAIQSEIQRVLDEVDEIARKQTSFEQKLVIVGDFMKTKLSMLTKNVEKVFGTDITFTLVKTNIKEGSWEEVCYPSVLKKQTPFVRGSESEKIRAGIYMIECIKKRLKIDDIPIIFDRSNDLDSKNLKNIGTKAQIITTRVDDINFNEVTLIHND